MAHPFSNNVVLNDDINTNDRDQPRNSDSNDNGALTIEKYI